VTSETWYTLPSNAFRDRVYMDWLLGEKSSDEELVEEYQDLIHQRFSKQSQFNS
jgi:hypothetical protein